MKLQRLPISRLMIAGLLAQAMTMPSIATAQGMTAKQADAILEELRQIRQLLERQQLPAPRAAQAPADEKVSIDIGTGGYSIGHADAPVVMVEYVDYQCPFCRQFHLSSFDRIKRDYVDKGRVRYVSRDFPLDFHKNARRAAVAARCAGEQDQFWQLRHVMIVNASQLEADNILVYARDLGLEPVAFRTCLESERYRAEVDRDLAEGARAGVSGTPSFLLGTLNGERLEGIRIVGAQSYQMFASKLDEALKRATSR